MLRIELCSRVLGANHSSKRAISVKRNGEAGIGWLVVEVCNVVIVLRNTNDVIG